MVKSIRPLSIILTIGIFTTLAFFNLIFEPTVLPKFLSLVFGALITLSIFFTTFEGIAYKYRLLVLLSVAYPLSLVISGVKNKQTIYEILVGTWGRYNGLLVVISYSILFIVGSLSTS